MGLNMTTRLLRGGHRVVATNRSPGPIEEARRHGAEGVADAVAALQALTAPRALWAMIPAGPPVDELIAQLEPHLKPGDLLVDGGNSNYQDSRRRHDALRAKGVHWVDAGTSGGIWGLEVGYCLMLGGDRQAIERLRPALETLAPPEGWLHVGPSGAGHFAKMIHNGIEYGMMQSYAEGFEILKASDYGYDLGPLCRLWNQGSVVRSWLLELAGRAFEKDPELQKIRGYVEDSGEGRWTVQEALDRDVPAPVLTLSLLSRFRSRQSDSFRDRVIAALRAEFGGHAVKPR
jgi:6-phosphogluconate dehydrogenase